MKWIADITQPIPMNFIIEEELLRSLTPGQPDVMGYYVYVAINGRGTHDYLQDSLQKAKSFTFKKFQVPLDAWVEVKDERL